MQGRGAWLHPDPACLARAVERKAIGRALRAPEADTSRLNLGSGERHPSLSEERDENPMSNR